MVGVDDLPLKVEGLHGTVNFAHDVVRLGLAPDAKMPLAALDRSPSVSLLHRSHRLVPQRSDPLRVGFVSGALLSRGWSASRGVELLEVLLLLGRLDPPVVDDQVVRDHESVVRVIAQKSRVDLSFLHSELLAHLNIKM